MTRGFCTAALVCLLAVWAVAATPPARAVEPIDVRVGIAVDLRAVHLAGNGPVSAADAATGLVIMLTGEAWTALPAPAGIVIDGAGFGPIVRLNAASGFLRVEGRPYRGAIELRRTPAGRLTVINALELEAYLYGVIKGEIDPRWPPEAVKAQAVAARTLVLERLHASPEKPALAGYDLPATTDAQVYLGAAAEDPAATAAVDATRGLLATYEGRPIFAAYHSNSGGHTEDSENVWGTVYPYLRAVPDPYALGAPGGEWKARLPLASVEAGLRRGGVDLTSLADVEPGRVTPWGRVVTVRLIAEDGRAQEVNANRFRLLIGPGVVRSTMFAVSRAAGDIRFTGRGSGHGVGLDQWGARALAFQGRTFEQILKYYYTGISVEQRF